MSPPLPSNPRNDSEGARLSISRYEFRRPRLFSPDLTISEQEARSRLARGEKVVVSRACEKFERLDLTFRCVEAFDSFARLDLTVR